MRKRFELTPLSETPDYGVHICLVGRHNRPVNIAFLPNVGWDFQEDLKTPNGWLKELPECPSLEADEPSAAFNEAVEKACKEQGIAFHRIVSPHPVGPFQINIVIRISIELKLGKVLWSQGCSCFQHRVFHGE